MKIIFAFNFNCWGHVPSLEASMATLWNIHWNYLKELKRVILFTLLNTSCTVFKCHTVVPDISISILQIIFVRDLMCDEPVAEDEGLLS
jgi:hypothetical protein